MGIFGQSTPFDADIEKATSEKNTTEDWTLILDVCDKVTSNPRNAKECLKAIMKRMGHPDPHVVIQAVTLLDACCGNCGKPFHLEVASREFENEFRRLLSKAQPQVSLKMRQLVKNWAENDFKSDPQLNLIPSLYAKLKSEGYDFSDAAQKAPKSASTIAALKDPNVVSSQQEEEDIAKAIELSLKEAKNSPKKTTTTTTTAPTTYPSLYPSFSGSSGSIGSITSGASTTSQPEPRKVRALYDFEAAEENELTFVAGEIIHVLDDSDPNWWKGYNQRGEGLFPSNFVTADLSVEPERLDINVKSKKTVQFEEETTAKSEDQKTEETNFVVEIDEQKIDRLLHLLHEANPEDSSEDTEEMLRLEQEVHQMGPLIDAELERVDRKHAQLTQLSSDLVDAINLYHTLMRDDRAAAFPGAGQYSMPPMGYTPQQMYGPGPYPPYMPAQQQNYHLPQQYPPMSMPSMQQQQGAPTSAPGHMPPVTAAGVNPMLYGPHMQHTPQSSPQQMIPVQFQNGRLNSAMQNGQSPQQMNNNNPQSNPQQQPFTPPQHQQQQQQQQQQQPQLSTQNFSQQPLPTQQQQPPQTMGQQHPMMQPPQQQHLQHTLPPNGQQQLSSPVPAQVPGQYHPHPQQAFLMRQYPMANGSGGYAAVPPPVSTAISSAAPPLDMMCNQQQVPGGLMTSAMAQQMAINQPVTQNFLVQNEAKTNIPVFQQQR
ncbi:signal transducing adapter molecule 1 [Episyrphus balteatus]|uniref:signal transducing adapter molecule 1 n=1 Tax=Episyrphus balteatus TaxID=286459 RepID=UPI002485C625|nr:signal transducing adapter molecule 1 [Episyrphus balteatus]